jgi:hypothetical protein
MNLQDRLSLHRPLIEPLEQRIAPALLVAGANLLGGAGNPSTGETSIGGNNITLVKVLSGEAIVWYDHGYIAAISVGPNTSLDITGNVGVPSINGAPAIPGDIIGNLTASGKLSDSDNNAANGLDGDVLLPNNILGITTHPLGTQLGTIGNIITGGSVSNLSISGNLEGVYAGTGAFYTGNTNPLLDSHVLSGNQVIATTSTVDVNPIQPGIQGGFVFASSNAKTVESGASISNVKILGAAEELQVIAGNGFAGTSSTLGHPGTPGLPGGSISNVTIQNAFIDTGLNASTPSYILLAGAGGNGSKGGPGGSISNINEISSSGVVDIIAGQGGIGSGAGGTGGSIKGLNMESVSSAYTIHAGAGGNGSPGGAGGSVVGVNFGGNELSNGIVVSAPFTGRGVDDILLVDSLSGTMVIEQNNGSGTGFTPVVQDGITNLTTISSLGADPVGAVVVTDSVTHLPDIVVAYKNSESLGVYINQGSGVFYTQDFTGGSYTGDTLDGTSLALPEAPTQIAAGNFTGDGQPDLAVLANASGQTELLTLAGNGLGTFTLLTSTVAVPGSNPVSLIAANIQGLSTSDLFVGFQSGLIDSLLSTGSTVTAPFNVVPSGVTVGGGILNLDYNSQVGLLLALNGTGTNITTYASNTAGALTQQTSLVLTSLPGTALVAHFVPEQQTIAEPIEVLTSVGSGSRLDVWNPQGNSFALTSSTSSTEALKNFVPVIEGSTSGVAAVGGSLEHFAFSQNGGPFFDVGLPFSGKKVSIGAGDGGDGVTTLTNLAAGGAGGGIIGMSILAGDINLTAGNGGTSINAPGGVGGMVADSPVLLTFTGQSIPTIIEADFVLTVAGGIGGTAAGTVHAASGGAGGAAQGLNLSLLEGTLQIAAGNGGDGGGGAGGNGGILTGIKSVDYGGDLMAQAGNGGKALGATGNGGSGGSIFNFNHSLSLTDQATETTYNVDLTAGYGGLSTTALGGVGGSIGNVNLTLQPSNESVNDSDAVPVTAHTDTDSTLRVVLTAGKGGDGATGGAGGAIKTINATAVYDQLVVVVGATAADTRTFPEVNPVTAVLTAGNGGVGSKGAGGVGGAVSSLNLAGISHFDPDSADAQAGSSPLTITSGNGGTGATTGGAGGAILGITSLNAQFEVSTSTGAGTSGATTSTTNENLSGTELSGATIMSGHGGSGGTGTGGVGGSITNLSVGVSGFYQDPALTVSGNGLLSGGQMNIQSGAGGGSTAGKGAAAGNIANLTVGCSNAYDEYGLLLQGGVGGTGALTGGTGGSVTNIQLNAPANPTPGTGLGAYDVLSTLILAGNGGGATGATTVGGLGGSISQIVESKDVNSSINLLQAGNGGSGGKTGGLGGSVNAVNTVGLIGQASDDLFHSFGVFETSADTAFFNTLFPAGVPEGVFAGRGGTGGTTAGLAGSVSSINAAQIAAIGAAVNSSGLFAAAERVANITAQVIGYDKNSDGIYSNQSGVSTDSPAVSAPIDGFLFSETIATGINTSNNALLEGFTFVG